VFETGDVVLVPFPFTDLTSVKTRPVVVVSVREFEAATSDFTVAMITSVSRETRFDYRLRDWRQANLLRPSWVRSKVATLNPGLVRFHPGRLSARDLTEVQRRIRASLGL
jgi:mRNA interferase MazF